jgi:hypothetical protein
MFIAPKFSILKISLAFKKYFVNLQLIKNQRTMVYQLCPNGHYYEPSLQGCPYCPTSQESNFNKTQIIQNNDKTMVNDDKTLVQNDKIANFNKTAIFTGNVVEEKQTVGTNQNTSGRKLVGWLVSFTLDPLGMDFKLREGRNIIGSDSACDIVVPDGQVSGKHLTILYRMGDFKFKDELSTNGTFINEEFVEEGNLKDGDTIRIGQTVFKFRTAH